MPRAHNPSASGISKPRWLKKQLPRGPQCATVERLLERLRLQTVCTSAKCPNRGECYGRGTATFMMLGGVCTRNCRFCAVRGGVPEPPDPEEPARIAQAVKKLGLKHVVVTSVTRDDLPDGGAKHFSETIREVRQSCRATIEVLTPDFKGDRSNIALVAGGDCSPDVYNHNVETVPRLYSTVRPQADYGTSLALLKFVKERWPHIITKSGLMVGLGESREELYRVMDDLRAVGCDAITVGQYLSPSAEHLRVARYVEPKEFDEYADEARGKGFRMVASGPFVRSSYYAEELLQG